MGHTIALTHPFHIRIQQSRSEDLTPRGRSVSQNNRTILMIIRTIPRTGATACNLRLWSFPSSDVFSHFLEATRNGTRSQGPEILARGLPGILRQRVLHPDIQEGRVAHGPVAQRRRGRDRLPAGDGRLPRATAPSHADTLNHYRRFRLTTCQSDRILSVSEFF